MPLIERWTDADRPLLARLVGDAAMMAHTGGAESPEKVDERQAKYVADPLQFRIVCDGEAVGWVGYWDHVWRGEDVYEIGWSVVPEYQGRGLASRATAAVLEHAREAGVRRFVHAFPAVANAPSNALCRKLGFELLGTVELPFPAGQTTPCNDWRVDLRR
jgi:RimJ/RimL family protein N-acetyltransferase